MFLNLNTFQLRSIRNKIAFTTFVTISSVLLAGDRADGSYGTDLRELSGSY